MHDAANVEPQVSDAERWKATAEAAERRLRVIDAIASVLAAETTAEIGVPRALSALTTALGCAAAAYWSLEGDALALTARWPISDDARDGGTGATRPRCTPGVGLAGRIWAERSPLWLNEVLADRTAVQGVLRDTLVAAQVHSGFGFPITIGSDVVGVVELFSRRAESFDPAFADTLRTIGARLGQFAQRTAADAHARQLHGELMLERAALERLNAVGRAIASELDHERVAQTVIDAATELTGAQLGALFYTVSAERTDSYMLYAVAGLSRAAFAKLPLPRNTAMLSPAFLGNNTVRVADVALDPRYGKNYPHKGLPEGHPVVHSFLAVPVTSRSGAPLGAIFLGHDRTGVFTERSERIAIELAAYAATALDNSQLYDEAQRLIAELEKTNAELDLFAYATSHDLRAPLRGISNLASWIDEDLPSDTEPSIKEHLRLLKVRAARMDRLINGLLELSRIGRARRQTERVDVGELLHETINLASPPDEARVMMIGEMPMLVTDRVALHQVLSHVIANALQHSERSDVVVRISAVDRGDEWELAIADNGVGIAPEHHARVWQLFQTLQSRDVAETTGLGLAIVRKQVERHGGRAWIDPAVSSGTTIRFTWPKRTK